MRTLIDALKSGEALSAADYETLLTADDEKALSYLTDSARAVRLAVYGRDVYMRGLIEFTNYCKNDCYYCGIRRGNCRAERYRLGKRQILDCCRMGYALGFRTFVLQGGEDPYFTDEILCEIVRAIKAQFEDCAVTLSVGERSSESYRALYEAGADRYLLRHETATKAHYNALHPEPMSFENRFRCLKALKEIGFQAGCGMMVGSPFQTVKDLARDLRFIKQFRPHMVGIGPFIPHADTPFGKYPAGSVNLTLRLISIVRLMLPEALLPATTALGTLSTDGRARGILAGANVVMPNLSPVFAREKYTLYDGKLGSGEEAAEGCETLRKSLNDIGYHLVVSRGDCKMRD